MGASIRSSSLVPPIRDPRQARLRPGAHHLPVVQQRHQHDPADGVAKGGGTRNPPRYSAQLSLPEKTLMRNSDEPAMQIVRPAAGIRQASEKMKKIWEMVSLEAATSQAIIATSHPPKMAFKNTVPKPYCA